MIAYHYSRIDSWVNAGSAEPLVPRTSLDGVFFKGTGWRATFALPEPLPTAWIDNPRFPHAWEELKKHMGKMLVELALTPTDQVMVLDQGLTYEYWPEGKRLPAWSTDAWVELERNAYRNEERYWNERIPLEQYLADPSKISLPEIIILNPIPRERVRISSQQPLIEETIKTAAESGNDFWTRHLLEQLRMGIPELQRWVAPCEATLRSQRPSKEIL